MAKTVLNLKGVHKQEPLPEGWYNATVKSAEPGESSNGNPVVRLIWLVEGGEHDGRTQPDHLNLTGDGLPITLERLEVLGLELPDPDSDEAATWELDYDDLVGAKARIKIKQSEWQGSVRSQVKDVKPYDSGLIAALE